MEIENLGFFAHNQVCAQMNISFFRRLALVDKFGFFCKCSECSLEVGRQLWRHYHHQRALKSGQGFVI